MNKDFKKALLSSLFGSGGVVSKSDFRSAISAIVDDLVVFKKEILEYVRGIRDGIDGHTPTDAELRALILPLIPEPKDGKTPTPKELLALIRPLIPEVKDERLLKLIKPLVPQIDGEDIIQRVNKDKSDLLIRKGKVEGFEELESALKTADANQRSWSNSGSFVYAQDISASLNGSTKTFTLVANAKVVMVFGSSAPGVFRPTVDYTTTGSTITFTSEITAASTLATGQTVIILYKLV